MTQWIFERYGRTGGVGGEGVTNALEGGGWKTREDLLAREAIQNSVDALDREGGERKASIRFRRSALTGKDKRAFLDRLNFDVLRQRAGPLQGPERDSVFKHADNLGKPLELLYVEDFRTVGLGGGLQDPKREHFYRLLFLVGEGGKAYDQEHSGGSYGYGKAVYSANSSVATIVVHSAFAPSPEAEGNRSRLLGCSFFRAHEHAGANYTGRAWFGEPAADQPDAPVPLVDKAADVLAKHLGFRSRASEERGTSMLIVGSDLHGKSLDMEALRRAIETWWWPLLLSGELDVEIFDGDEKLDGPRPRRAEREDLKPYVDCWLGLDGGKDGVKVQGFNRVARQFDIGRLALRALDEEEAAAYAQNGDEDEADAQAKAPGLRKIALIRSTRMVVAYQAFGSPSRPPFAGVFRADDAVDRHLKLSEPPAHDRWDSSARRLMDQSHGQEVAEAVALRLRRAVIDYQKQLEPPKPKPKERLSWLDKMFGEMLKHKDKRPPPPPGGEKGPVSVHFVRIGAEADGSQLRFRALVELALKDRIEEEFADVLVKPTVNILEGEAGARGDALKLMVFDSEGNELANSSTPQQLMTVRRDERIQLELVSEPYSSDWTVDLHMEIEPVEEESRA